MAAVGHRDWHGGTAPDSPTPSSDSSVPNPSIPGISSALAAAERGTPPPRLDLAHMYGDVSDETAGSLAMVGRAVEAQLDELDRDGQAFGERVDPAAAGRDPVRFALEQEAHIEEVRRRAAAKLGIADEPPISVSQPHPPRALPQPRIAPPPASSSAPSVHGPSALLAGHLTAQASSPILARLRPGTAARPSAASRRPRTTDRPRASRRTTIAMTTPRRLASGHPRSQGRHARPASTSGLMRADIWRRRR